MEILNNISPLPFYTDISLQHHRKDYAFGQIYPLMSEGEYLLPFQFILSTSGAHSKFNDDFDSSFSKDTLHAAPEALTIENISLVDFVSGISQDITSKMLIKGLSYTQISPDLYLFKYPATAPIFAISHEGPYYLIIQLNIGSLYSEVFISSEDVSNYIKLDYGNTYNFQIGRGYIDFSENFRFKCYLDAKIGKPEYIFEETATERMGYTFIESQISKKVHRFVCIAPEFLCDALRVVRLCNSKRIFYANNYYEPFSFSINPKWEEQGDLASVECEFETDTIITNIGNIQ